MSALFRPITVVGELPAAVALVALGLGIEQHEAALGAVRNGFLVAFDPGVERRASGNHRALVGGDHLGNRFGRDAFAGERGFEQLKIMP